MTKTIAPAVSALHGCGSLHSLSAVADAASTMAAASPLSLKTTFRQLRLGVPDLKAALTLEYRLTQHILASGDFFEGVRAALVDKDRRPRWRHRSLAEVSPEEVEDYFAELGERELIFR